MRQPYRYSGFVAVFITSIASGLPLLLVSQTLQAWFTQYGVDLVTIGALSFVSLPYVLKCFWAPLMDRYAPFSSHRRRDWLLCTQLLLVVGLVFLSQLTPQRHAFEIALLACGLAFFSASQDIVVDGYRVDVLSEKQRGMGAAVQMLGYRVGMLIAGAGAMLLADKVGWSWTFCLMAAAFVVLVCYSLCLPRTLYEAPPSASMSFLDPYRELVSRKNVGLLVAFALLYKISDNVVFSLNMPFLLRHLKFGLSEVAWASNAVSVLGVSVGSVVAGIILYRVAIYRALFWFGWLQLLSNLGYVLLAWYGHSVVLMIATMFVENCCGGMATAAFTAYLTGRCDQRFSASQYALFAVLMALPRILLGPLLALLVEKVGWVEFYFLSALVGVVPIALLFFLRRSDCQHSQVVLQQTG